MLFADHILVLVSEGSPLCSHISKYFSQHETLWSHICTTFSKLSLVFLIFPFNSCPILQVVFLESLYSKLMSNLLPQYLVKSIADRVRLGLGLTLAQWVRVRANPSSIPTRCCGSSEAGSNSASEMREHRAVGT